MFCTTKPHHKPKFAYMLLLISCTLWAQSPPPKAAPQPVGTWVDTSTLSELEMLGNLLFFDKNLSNKRTMSCSSCHSPQHGFADPRPNPSSAFAKAAGAVSIGDDNASLGTRNAPTASYAKLSPIFGKKGAEFVGGQFLDGREPDLAGQAGGPPLNPVEMQMPDKKSVVARIFANPDYRQRFAKLFGKESLNDVEQSYKNATLAIQAFEKTEFFAPFDSKYDRYLRGEYELTILEDLGRTLFFSNNNVSCKTCHVLKEEDATGEPFSNYEYHNIGVPANPRLKKLVAALKDDVDKGLLDNPHAKDDLSQIGKFKVPTLRNVAVTGPYMHNGVFHDLRTVVLFYDKYNNPAHNINPETGKVWDAPEVPSTVNLEDLKAQKFTERKVDALVAFMKLLTDRRYEPLLAQIEKEEAARTAARAKQSQKTQKTSP